MHERIEDNIYSKQAANKSINEYHNSERDMVPKSYHTRLTGFKSDRESYDLSTDDDTGKKLQDN